MLARQVHILSFSLNGLPKGTEPEVTGPESNTEKE
jgi:hypothetical protein